MNFNFVPYHYVANKIKENLPKIVAELNEDYGSIDIDWDFYLDMSTAGQCFAAIAFDKELAGVFIYFIANDPHNKARIEADNTLMFVAKEHRGIGGQLQDFAESHIKALGAKSINYLIKDKRIARLLSRKAFKAEYTKWSKEI